MEQTKKGLHEDLEALRINRQKVEQKRLPKWRYIYMFLILTIGIAILLFIVRPGTLWLRLGITGKSVHTSEVIVRRANNSGPVLSAGGYIIARTQVEVGSKITGRIISLDVDEGDTVKKGQVIAHIDDSELNAQVLRAKANLDALRSRLAVLKAGSRPEEIEQAKAKMERANAEMVNAELTLRRIKRLVVEEVLQQQLLDDSQARFEMARNSHYAAQKDYELSRTGPRKEEIEMVWALVNQAKAELALAQAQFENTIIRAPIDGVVLNRYVSVGAMVTTGFTSDLGAKQALVSIANPTDLQVELEISEANIARMQLGQQAIIIPDAYLDHHYKGELEYIAAAANRQRATIKVKVKVKDADRFLRPDMGVKVSFYQNGEVVAQKPETVLIPESALISRDNHTVVFIVNNGRPFMQNIIPGRKENGYIEILSGLKGGETVIVSGQDSLKENDSITVEN